MKEFFHQKKWSTISVQGKDSIAFLQNMLTQDVKDKKPGDFVWSCLLTNKSKLIALMGLVFQENQIVLCMHQKLVDQVFDILETYTVIQEVTLEKIKQEVYFEITSHDIQCTLSPHAPMLEGPDFEIRRLALGFPVYLQDYEDPLPLEIPFMLDAISFTKGCYVGQETIARLYSRGMNISRKLVKITSATAFHKEEKLFHQTEEVGVVTSVGKKEKQWIGLGWLHRKGFDQEIFIGEDKKNCSIGHAKYDTQL